MTRRIRTLLVMVILLCTHVHTARAQDVVYATPMTDFWDTVSPWCTGVSAGVDYLLWWIKPVCLTVPTISSGSPTDAVPGAFGQPGTKLVAGQTRFEFEGASGYRPYVTWTTRDGFWTAEVKGFELQTVSSTQAGPATGFTYIPFKAPDNTNQAVPFTIPGVVDGSFAATGSSRLWGVEINGQANLLKNQYGNCLIQSSTLAGFRYLDLTDRVVIRNTQRLAANPLVSVSGEDHCETQNRFFGVQVGQRVAVTSSRCSLEGYGKLAVGSTNLTSDFAGSPLAGAPVLPGVFPGPIVVLPSNTGVRSTDRVTLVPEIGTTFRYAVSECWTLSFGYSLLYWNRILCPGDLMDPTVNPTSLPFRGPPTGPAAPVIQPKMTDYFAQGVNLGFEFKF